MNEERKCCICGRIFRGWGNNPYPVVQDVEARCCDVCNATAVVPARLEQLYRKEHE